MRVKYDSYELYEPLFGCSGMAQGSLSTVFREINVIETSEQIKMKLVGGGGRGG